MRILVTAIIIGAASSLASSADAASVRCLEGKTATGECVNASLAAVIRKESIIISQPKISGTTPLNLPSEDGFYPRRRDHHEDTYFFRAPAQRPGTIAP